MFLDEAMFIDSIKIENRNFLTYINDISNLRIVLLSHQ